MNTKKIIFLSLMCVFIYACKDETVDPADPIISPTPKKSKIGLFCNEWVLKETFEDGVQKTTNGTGQYRFTKNGKFAFKESGIWQDIGTYSWLNSDSNAIWMNFGGGGASEILMQIKKLDEHNYHSEFGSAGKKLNYNYTR